MLSRPGVFDQLALAQVYGNAVCDVYALQNLLRACLVMLLRLLYHLNNPTGRIWTSEHCLLIKSTQIAALSHTACSVQVTGLETAYVVHGMIE